MCNIGVCLRRTDGKEQRTYTIFDADDPQDVFKMQTEDYRESKNHLSKHVKPNRAMRRNKKVLKTPEGK